jgi:hypothetical protein
MPAFLCIAASHRPVELAAAAALKPAYEGSALAWAQAAAAGVRQAASSLAAQLHVAGLAEWLCVCAAACALLLLACFIMAAAIVWTWRQQAGLNTELEGDVAVLAEVRLLQDGKGNHEPLVPEVKADVEGLAAQELRSHPISIDSLDLTTARLRSHPISIDSLDLTTELCSHPISIGSPDLTTELRLHPISIDSPDLATQELRSHRISIGSEDEAQKLRSHPLVFDSEDEAEWQQPAQPGLGPAVAA